MKFFCEKCNYGCRNKKDFSKHLSTRKHTKDDAWMTKMGRKSPIYSKSPQMNNVETKVKKEDKTDTTIKSLHNTDNNMNEGYACICGRIFKYRQGLFKHKKICLEDEDQELTNYGKYCSTLTSKKDNEEINGEVKDIIKTLISQNQELQKSLLEIVPHIQGNNITTNSHNTINNNQFNISMFLNEKCKDAMNLTDFIDSLPITAEVLDDTRVNGLTHSLTHMFVTGLNTMDIYKRPIHCTDPKRKVMYVKDNDVWERDDNQQIIKTGVSKLAVKQRANISKWQDANDGWETKDHLQILMTSLVGQALQLSDRDPKEQNKILKGICNATYLNTQIKEQNKYIK